MAILDAAGKEIVRHPTSGFLGEMNLLTGQTVYVTAVATKPLRYIEVDRDALRPLLFEDGPLSDLLLSTFIARREALQQVEGIGFEVVGPRSSAATMRIVEFARSNRVPLYLARPRATGTRRQPRWSKGSTPPSCRSCACRVAWSGAAPRPARSPGRSGSDASSHPEKRSISSSSAAAPQASARRSMGRPRVWRRSSSRAPRSAGRRARRDGSRTTSGSRQGSAARS